jgi:hypothetical protein
MGAIPDGEQPELLRARQPRTVRVDQRSLLSWAACYAPQPPEPKRRPSTSFEEPQAAEDPQAAADNAVRKAARRAAEAEETRQRGARLAVKQSLKDGVVLLRILMDVFPTAAETFERHLQPHPANRHAVNHNWKCIDACVSQLELPESAVDRAGLSVSRDRATNTILATLYFLYQLKRRPNFTAAFAFRLDEQIEDFLQSGRCLTSLAHGGAVPQAAHLARPLKFDAEIPAELTDPQMLWRYGAGLGHAHVAPRRGSKSSSASGQQKWGKHRSSTQQAVRNVSRLERKPLDSALSNKPKPSASKSVPVDVVPAELLQQSADRSETAPELSTPGQPLLSEEQEELLYLRQLRKVHT